MPRTPWSSRSPRSTLLEDEALAQRGPADAGLRDAGAGEKRVEHRDTVDDQVGAGRIETRRLPPRRERQRRQPADQIAKRVASDQIRTGARRRHVTERLPDRTDRARRTRAQDQASKIDVAER